MLSKGIQMQTILLNDAIKVFEKEFIKENTYLFQKTNDLIDN